MKIKLTAEMTGRLLRFYELLGEKTNNRILDKKKLMIRKLKGTTNILELCDIFKKINA